MNQVVPTTVVRTMVYRTNYHTYSTTIATKVVLYILPNVRCNEQ